ncbi:MAG TPA: hypothetical protein VFN02_16875 [Ktedonobacteraceae bacterium]|nr:hypothetical protein [Ktedonobacteraceae bacterium]
MPIIHHLLVGDVELFRRLLLEEEMEARQARSQGYRVRAGQRGSKERAMER